jgi:ABC-type taurine transport system substrate-binding protein
MREIDRPERWRIKMESVTAIVKLTGGNEREGPAEVGSVSQ